MQRTYAVLKCIVAFFSAFTGVLLVISVFHLTFFTSNLSHFHGVGERILVALVLLGMLYLAYAMCRFGYRLFMRVKSSGDLKRKKPLTPVMRKLWAVIYVVAGSLLMIGFLATVDKDPAQVMKNIEPGNELLLRFWCNLALMFVGSALLLKSGYSLWKPAKEKIALPEQQH